MSHQKHIGLEIKKLHNLVTRNFEKSAESAGVTRVQARVLHFICMTSQSRDCFQKDVEKEFNLQSPSATELIKRLVNLGYLERVSLSQDKRFKKLHVTEIGKEKMHQVYQQILYYEQVVTTGVSDEQLELFFSVIDKMKQNIENNLREEKE